MTDVDFLEPAAEEQILATHQIVLSRAAGETGVINGNRIPPTSPTSMTVNIGAGRIKISNTPDDVDAEAKLIGAADATLGRMDIIIRNSSGAVQVVAGSLAAVNDPKGNGNWHQYDSPAPAGMLPAGAILGVVYVAPAVSAISSSDIWMFAGPVGESAHTQGTDQGLDTGGPNAVTVAQIRAAVVGRSYELEFGLVGSPATIPLGFHESSQVPISGTIIAARLMSNDDTSGSINVTLGKRNYAHGPGWPGLGSALLISSSTQNEYTGLSLPVVAGDWVIPYVNSVTNLKSVTLSLTVSVS